MRRAAPLAAMAAPARHTAPPAARVAVATTGGGVLLPGARSVLLDRSGASLGLCEAYAAAERGDLLVRCSGAACAGGAGGGAGGGGRARLLTAAQCWVEFERRGAVDGLPFPVLYAAYAWYRGQASGGVCGPQSSSQP